MACAPPPAIISTATPRQLTLAQSAMLAGLVQAPSRLAPTHNLAAGPEAQPAGARRRWPTPAIISLDARACDRARAPGRASDRRCRPAPISPTGSRPRRRRRSRPTSARSRCATTLDADLQRLAVRAVGRAPDRRCAGGAGRDAARRARRRDGRRAQLQGEPVQPRDPGPAPAGIGVQAVRLSRRVARRLDARQHHRGPAGHHRRLDPGQQRRRLSRPDHAARSLRPVEQCGDGPPVGKRRPAQCAARRARARHFDARCPTARASRSARPG